MKAIRKNYYSMMLLAAIIMTFVMLNVIKVVVQHAAKENAECRAKKGVPFYGRQGMVCLSRDVVIE